MVEGASSRSMTLAELAAAKGFSATELAGFGVRDGFDRVEIPYYTATHALYSRMRIRNGERGFSWTAGDAPLIPYGLWKPVEYSKHFLLIVEGESDCWAAWLAGVPALGIPGANAASVLSLQHVAGVSRIAVVQEPGDAGERFPHRIALRLRDVGYTGECFAIALGKYKDIREAFNAGRDTFTLRLQDAWRARVPIVTEQSLAQEQWPEFLSMAQLRAKPRVSVEWLVDGLIPTGGPALLVSKPKVGKSVFARSLAYAVAAGIPFLDREVRAGPVLWCGFEEGEEFILDEFEALGADDGTPIYVCANRAPQDALRWLEEAAKKLHPGLIVVDTWQHLTRVKDTNSYAEVTAANAPLVALAREYAAAMLWLHHANKSHVREDSVLGSNALLAAVDVLIGITRDSSGGRSLWTRQRRGDDIEDELLVRDEQTGAVSFDGSRFAAEVRKAKNYILDALHDCGPLVRVNLLAHSKTRKQAAVSALRQLTANGEVILVRGTGVRGDPLVFDLSDTLKASSAGIAGISGISGSNGRYPVPANVHHLNCRECGLRLNPAMPHPRGLCQACERDR